MKSFVEQAQIYASYHQLPMTRYTHMAGVPLIIISFMIFLGFLKLVVPGVYETNLACLATLALLIYYFRQQWTLALAITPILLFCLWIASWFNHNGPTQFGLWAFFITFVLGWSLQLYAHIKEGSKPAFTVNLDQALIAPLFLTAELFFMAGLMQSLKDQIYAPEQEDISKATRNKK